jgi:hypothetical protein
MMHEPKQRTQAPGHTSGQKGQAPYEATYGGTLPLGPCEEVGLCVKGAAAAPQAGARGGSGRRGGKEQGGREDQAERADHDDGRSGASCADKGQKRLVRLDGIVSPLGGHSPAQSDSKPPYLRPWHK